MCQFKFFIEVSNYLLNFVKLFKYYYQKNDSKRLLKNSYKLLKIAKKIRKFFCMLLILLQFY